MQQVTMYMYHNVMGREEVKLLHCIFCKRPLFKSSAKTIVIANIFGNYDSFLPGAHYIEHKCHSCPTVYRILFQ